MRTAELNQTKVYTSQQNFTLESGVSLPSITIAYHTYGQLNEQKNNVVWVCHAFTGNGEATDWWAGLVGIGQVFDPERYFIVCANVLGSCYGTTGPSSINPQTGQAYYGDFPQVTIRDMVQAHILLRQHLGIESIHVVTGGSMGGQQALEWLIMEKTVIQNAFLVACNYKHSPWGIAFNESQRMAIAADSSFGEAHAAAGLAGMAAARSIAMLSYRHYDSYWKTQLDDNEVQDNFKAASYQQYQGQKLTKRFNAYAYWTLSKAMDSHNIARNRGRAQEILQTISANVLIMGIDTDSLFPVREQKMLHQHIPNSQLAIIESPYGHDGFLIEYDKIVPILNKWLS